MTKRIENARTHDDGQADCKEVCTRIGLTLAVQARGLIPTVSCIRGNSFGAKVEDTSRTLGFLVFPCKVCVLSVGSFPFRLPCRVRSVLCRCSAVGTADSHEINSDLKHDQPRAADADEARHGRITTIPRLRTRHLQAASGLPTHNKIRHTCSEV